MHGQSDDLGVAACVKDERKAKARVVARQTDHDSDRYEGERVLEKDML